MLSSMASSPHSRCVLLNKCMCALVGEMASTALRKAAATSKNLQMVSRMTSCNSRMSNNVLEEKYTLATRSYTADKYPLYTTVRLVLVPTTNHDPSDPSRRLDGP
jgi:hypothetical protein